MPIITYRWVLQRPVKFTLWLVLAISTSQILTPEIAKAQPPVTNKTSPPSAQAKEIPSNSIVVEAIATGQEVAQNEAIPTPSTTPNQSTTDTDTPVNPSAPIIPAPGTEGIPQQETPNQLEFDITPGNQTPTIENNPPPSTTPPVPQGTPTPGTATPEADSQSNPEVLVGEVLVQAQEGQLTTELENEVYQAIRTQPGRTATRSQLQEDINAIFATGFFANVRAEPQDTPLGVRVTFIVQPNPILRAVRVQANTGTDIPSVIPEKVVDDIFKEQYGSILNLRRFQEGIKQLNKWYQDNGYVLAQVNEAPQVAADGTVTLAIAEGVIEDIQISFRNKEGDATDDEGKPIVGRTREFIITRELELKPGQIFNRTTVQRDLQRVFGLGLFEDVNVSLNPGEDPRKVIVTVNVDEKNSGSVGAGAGFSSSSGLFGSLSYQQQNLGGNNQDLGAEFQIGQRELLFDLRFTDPWIGGDPYRTSYTVNTFRRRTTSLIFDGGENEITLPNDDRPRILRLGGGVNFTRPLSKDPLRKSEWTASAGLEYQRVSIRDSDGELSPEDELGNELSFSGDGTDDLLTLQAGAVRDRRNDAIRPTSGSLVRFGVEQSVPIGAGNILLNRVRGSYSQYFPVSFINFSDGPQTLAFNIQGGTVLGDLPPYEAFLLGGSNSVRGYDEGDLGSGRSFVQATAEYRFPVFSIVGGALFFDVGTDLGSGNNVPGDPAGVRGKSGSGFGYGLGVRVQSPLGPIRIDYGFTDEGDSRLHFGIGERF
ncbi:BamA/TamA family outer membrane protein [Synechocystis sp. PCC 7509]|uniref:BamA/TamA family outer membrane protein n=1 Tax=Synechocystis sp. PCC 7509 TaxID=927677 RepID=UPI0002AC653E|nr:BamA/TamA family outer membrane protein [Synechocystis sp. PCC 7509]